MNEFGFDFYNQLKEFFPDFGNINVPIVKTETGLTETWFDEFNHSYLTPHLTLIYTPVAQATLIEKLRQNFAEESTNVKRFVESFISKIAMPHVNVLDEKFAEQLAVQLDEINIHTPLNTEQLSHVKATVAELVNKTHADINEIINLVAGGKLLGIKACLEHAYQKNKDLNTSIQMQIDEYMKSSSKNDKKEDNRNVLKKKLAEVNTVDERRKVWEALLNDHPGEKSKFGHLIRSVIEKQKNSFSEIDKTLNDLKRLMAELQVICMLDVLSKEAEEMKQTSYRELQRLVTSMPSAMPSPISGDTLSTVLGYQLADVRVDTASFPQLSAPPSLPQAVMGTVADECQDNDNAGKRSEVTNHAIGLSAQSDLMPFSGGITVTNFKYCMQNLHPIRDEDLEMVRFLVSGSSAPKKMLKCLLEEDRSRLKTHIMEALQARRLQWQEVIPLNFLFSKDEFDLIEEARVNLLDSSVNQANNEARNQEITDVAVFIATSPSAYSCYSIFLQPTAKQYPKDLTKGVINALDNLLMQRASQIGTSNRIVDGKEEKDRKIKRSFVKIQLILQEYRAASDQSEYHKQELTRLLKEEFIILSKIVSTHRSINFLGCSKTKSEQALTKFLSAPDQSLLRNLLGVSQTAGVNVSKAVESFLDECKKKDTSEARGSQIQTHP